MKKWFMLDVVNVSIEITGKICTALECDISDIRKMVEDR